jgi:hypothetical protein
MKKRANKLQKGDVFKKSEPYVGTTTFKVIGVMRRNTHYTHQYDLPCVVVKTTGDYYKKYIGKEYPVTFSPRYNRFTEVTLVNTK